MKNKILFGDCRDTLPTIDVKARMCVTSPPYYGLRNYGGEENQIGQEDTPEQFIDNLVSDVRVELYDTWADQYTSESFATAEMLPGFGALMVTIGLLGAAMAGRRD